MGGEEEDGRAAVEARRGAKRTVRWEVFMLRTDRGELEAVVTGCARADCTWLDVLVYDWSECAGVGCTGGILSDKKAAASST